MLVKYIRCGVDSASREEFSLAQMGWEPLKHVPGFIRQFGGWTRPEGDADAVIFGLWESRASYDYFMSNLHDSLIGASSQMRYLQSISAALFEEDEDIVHRHAASSELLDSFGARLDIPAGEVELVGEWEIRAAIS
ncbi:YdbC family protein [Bacillus infantis]|uniref:YdbC family protein n=1 Tax=Bacillus infantis TaxID=324767 RepID=UPI002FBD465A